MITAYLATPAVFRPAAKAYGEYLKAVCARYGVQGVYPLDNESTDPQAIYIHNIRTMNDCNFILADVSPFRGPSLDAGVSFEIGYAMGVGKPVIAYNVPKSVYKERVSDTHWHVEDFGLSENLMLAHSYDFSCADIEEALSWIKDELAWLY